MADALVILPIHEATQRREPAAQQKLEIANLPTGQVPGGKICGARFEFGGVFRVELKVDQFAAVRGDKVAVRLCIVYIVYIHDEERFYTIERLLPQRRPLAKADRSCARVPSF